MSYVIDGMEYEAKDIFCNARDVLPHNCILNFILGAKGCGKTYGALTYCISDFLKKGNKFIYLRRYDTELTELNELFTTINVEEFNDYVIGARGKNFYVAKMEDLMDEKTNEIKMGKLYKEEYHCGKAIALSSTVKLKSKDFVKYNKVIFEEFIIMQQHVYYIKNEPKVFMELIDTIFRHRKVRIFLFGNNMTTINPYFIYFNIKNPKTKGITKYKIGNRKVILVWYYHNPLFIKYKNQSDIGLLEQFSGFDKYAISNETLYDNQQFIEKKTKDAQFKFSLLYQGNVIGIWLDTKQGKVYATYKYPKGWEEHYACSTDDMKPNAYFFRRMKKNYNVTLLNDAFSYGFLYYDNVRVKEQMNEIFKLFSIY